MLRSNVNRLVVRLESIDKPAGVWMMRSRLSIFIAACMIVGAPVIAFTARPVAAYPFMDTIPANGGSNPDDHGWFEADRQWVGDFGDPTVVKVGSTYYAYSSPTGGRYLPVLTSTDLRTWMIHPNWSTNGPVGAPGYNVYTDPAIPAEIRASGQSPWDTYLLNDGLVSPPTWGLYNATTGPWVTKDYWAPGVIQIGATWFAYGAVKTSTVSDDPHGYGRFCLTVASAPSPFGPFRDISGGGPIQCQSVATDPAGSIDPFPYRDPSTGRYYLLWKAAGKIGVSESSILATEIGTNGFPVGGPTVKLLETNRADAWEGGTIENPGMISFGGTTYLFYSANDSAAAANGTSSYATGYAVCPSGPLGPCARIQHTPLLSSFYNLQGPGGSSPFIGPDGELRLAYAVYEAGEPARSNGLHPRRLHIAVLLRNADGTLRYLGDEGNVPPPTAPGAPTSPLAAPGNTWATVSWDPPLSDGGRSVTSYTVTASPGGKTCSWTTGPRRCTVTGLSNGTSYTFTVTATNAVGTGAASAATAAVTPAVPPNDYFFPIEPTRILDSRPSTQVGPFSSPWSAGTVRNVQVAGLAGVPSGADAVTLNVTVTDTTAPSYLTVWPKGEARPTASNLNWSPGQTIPNAVTVKVGVNDSVSVFSVAGAVNVVVDAVGYYEDPGAQAGGAGFTPLTPSRILDSRPQSQVGPYGTPWFTDQSRTVTVTGAGGVPTGAEAVVMNVTVTGTTAASYLTVAPHGGSRPTVSNLNWLAGDTIANAVTVKLPAGGAIDVYSMMGGVDVIIDVVGYFDVGTGAAFHPLTPARVQDSRVATGDYATPWSAGTSRDIHVGGGGGVPEDAVAVLSNVTVTNTTAPSFLSLWPAGGSRPTVSTLNWKTGVTIPNAATTRLGVSGMLGVYSHGGNADVLVDVAGWYG